MSTSHLGNRWRTLTPYLLSTLRIITAFLFMQFGTAKWFALPGPIMPDGSTVSLTSLVGLAAVLETVGGLLLLVGLFSRPVAFVLSGQMAVAYVIGHAPQGFWPVLNQGTPAILFSFLWLYFSAAGPGPWSLDAWRERGESRDSREGRKGLSTAAAIVVLVFAPTIASAQRPSYPRMAPVEQYLMADRDGEITLARSAAPPAISSEATVLVLTRRGYEAAVKGTTGFVCLVDRAWQATFGDPEFWNHKIRAPVCLNPQAARSILPIAHRRTELALAGRSKAEIMDRITTAHRNKAFGPPEIGAMSYMMSKDQYLGDQFVHWQPHLMFYIPGSVEGRHWGADLPNSPVVLGPDRLPNGSREPVNVFVVPVAHWSDGSQASGDRRSPTRP